MLMLTPEEYADDMLINAEMHVGGRIGVGPDEGQAVLRERGFIGPRGGLTRTGLAEARKLYREYWEAGEG